jgi:uncharacterized flavoprotein (TIGR03862 family)
VTRSAAVIGGGPAGLMAAETLARAGVTVTVYEHMPSVGRKLLLAGRAGLNLTHSEPVDKLVARYGAATPRLESAIRAFSPRDLRSWCASLGETTFVGSTGRVFPASFRATPLLRSWLARLPELGVRIEPRHRWLGWAESSDGRPDPSVSMFSRPDGTRIEVANDATVFALGGASWPRVGSDGGWVDLFRGAGVLVNDLRSANVGVRIRWSQHYAERFAGVPLKNVAVSVAGTTIRGDAMITKEGLEGGPIYAHSGAIRQALDREGRCIVSVDLQPDLTADRLIDRFARNRRKDSTATFLHRTIGLQSASASLLRESTGNRIPTDHAELAALVKSASLVVDATMPIARAISSAGGIDLSEVDESFMLQRLPGSFVAGEMLDWEAPTGGYLLQACFSTGMAAGRGALAWIDCADALFSGGGQR